MSWINTAYISFLNKEKTYPEDIRIRNKVTIINIII
jgi:hypothetical protein